MKITFGKHKGQDIKELPAGYLLWVIKNVKKLDPDMKKEVQKALSQKKATLISFQGGYGLINNVLSERK